MRQVLFYIPLKADWLPLSIPLYLFLLVVGLGLGLFAWLLSRRAVRPALQETFRGAAFWLAGFGVVSALVVRLAANNMPNGLPIYGFGMMLFLAFIICTWLAGRRAEGEGIARVHIQDLTIWLFIGGLIGARITFLRFEKGMAFSEMFGEIYKIWDGGIVLYGSVVGALAGYAVAYVFVFRKYRLSTLKLADIVAPSIAVGLCLGRFGCFLNGCCYGQVACPTCPVYTVHFPLSAPAREGLVDQGYQTAAGFTLDTRGLTETQLKELMEQKLHELTEEKRKELTEEKREELAEQVRAEWIRRELAKEARVRQVDPQSAAYASGLRSGDVIEHMNGKDIYNVKNLIDGLVYWPRGETKLSLVVRHPGAAKSEDLPVFEPQTLGLHPTQLYEVVSMFLMFLVLTAYYPLRRREGQVIAVLMVGYGIHRYLNELLRDDPRPKGIESYTSVLLVAAGIGLWLYLQRGRAVYRTAAKETAVAAERIA
jgi:phosphatidylglycerol:prolipoprotein diacylglycerol transferase